LIQLRKAKGITQTELAHSSGVSQRVVAMYETTVKNPTADIVLRLARALDLSVDQLMGRRPVKAKEAVSRKTLLKAKRLEELSSEDQKTIDRMIESLHAHAANKT
jgi:transcriptional regulator with XRE-family HTH domain